MAIGQTSGILKSVKSTAAIATAYTMAKFGADDDTMSLTTAVGDALTGIFQSTTVAANDQVEVMLTGISRIKLGGTVARGDVLTSNASGQGVVAAPSTGTNNNIIGTALKSGVSGDVGVVLLGPGKVQG